MKPRTFAYMAIGCFLLFAVLCHFEKFGLAVAVFLLSGIPIGAFIGLVVTEE